MNIRLEIPLERLIGILRRTPTAIFGQIAHKLWVLQILRNRMQGNQNGYKIVDVNSS